jgi:hypothetical protein
MKLMPAFFGLLQGCLPKPFLPCAGGLDLAFYQAYDSDLGRWLNRNPIQELGGLNLYDYVGNDSINAIAEPSASALLAISIAVFLGSSSRRHAEKVSPNSSSGEH